MLRAPEASAERPYLHVGHGVSCARKTWGLVAILREPLRAPIKGLGAPVALDTIEAKVGERVVVLLHDADSLQWVVAATYPSPGPRADQGEATGEQWAAFNEAVDATLQRLHQRQPIAAVIRPIDEEYGTAVSDWHAWSMGEAPRYMRFLYAAGRKARWYVEHACDLWRAWLGEQPLADQQRVIDALAPEARKVLRALGGVPQAQEPVKPPPEPTLDEMKAAWAAIPPEADVVAAFAAAFAHRGLAEPWDLFGLQHALLDPAQRTPAHAPLLREVLRRALASPGCRWPDTHWRPHLVDELVRAGQLDEARAEVAPVVLGANSYNDNNWETMVGLCDALGRRDDGDALHRMAERYVTGYSLARKVAKLGDARQRAAASRVVRELAAPALAPAALDALDDDALSHAAFLFESLCKQALADQALAAEGARLRAASVERHRRRQADAEARFARGDTVDVPQLLLLVQARQGAAALEVAEVERLARAAAAHPGLIVQVAALAHAAHGTNIDAALAVYGALLAAPIPPDGYARTSWLYAANNALIVSHAARRFADSARMADQVVQYAPENPHITHAAACSYAAVGRHDDALAQVARAVELGYPHLDRVKVDPHLGPLLARADFQALLGKPRR
ncbi:MAG: hypothetical protein IPL61_27400 [Myxococcales bacterium]|nr:hypothetical protein [Myxococcales bacterium]